MALFLAGLGGCASSDQSLHRFKYTAIIMAAEARIVLYAPDEESAGAAVRAAFERMNELDGVMSDFQPNSELMRLCAAPPGVAHRVSEDLFRVLDRAMRMTELTHGAFDITIGPVTHLWRGARTAGVPPQREVIERAMKRCGPHLITLDHVQQAVTLHAPAMQLDLGGIGKGFAVDESAMTLRANGIERFLIGLAGDLRSGQPPPGENGWRIGIDAGGDSPTHDLLPANRAISTSGDLYQFLKHEGTRHSHIIDPRTGHALTRQITVTIIADDATTADALATALSLLGPEAAPRVLAAFPCTQATFAVIRSDGSIKQQRFLAGNGRVDSVP